MNPRGAQQWKNPAVEKAGFRKKKIALIEKMNPQWQDLYPHLKN